MEEKKNFDQKEIKAEAMRRIIAEESKYGFPVSAFGFDNSKNTFGEYTKGKGVQERVLEVAFRMRFPNGFIKKEIVKETDAYVEASATIYPDMSVATPYFIAAESTRVFFDECDLQIKKRIYETAKTKAAGKALKVAGIGMAYMLLDDETDLDQLAAESYERQGASVMAEVREKRQMVTKASDSEKGRRSKNEMLEDSIDAFLSVTQKIKALEPSDPMQMAASKPLYEDALKAGKEMKERADKFKDASVKARIVNILVSNLESEQLKELGIDIPTEVPAENKKVETTEKVEKPATVKETEAISDKSEESDGSSYATFEEVKKVEETPAGIVIEEKEVEPLLDDAMQVICTYQQYNGKPMAEVYRTQKKILVWFADNPERVGDDVAKASLTIIRNDDELKAQWDRKHPAA